MKLFYIAVACFFVACNDTGKRDTTFLPESVGNINTLQVVITNELWNGPVGEEIRAHFAAPVDGLPQEEPLFSMNQMPPATYTGFARKYRNFLHISIGDKDKVAIEHNPYANPQTGAFITARTPDGLITLLEEKHQELIDAFKATELKENQRRIRISLKNTDSLKAHFGISLSLPSAYRTAIATREFYWFRKDLKSGSSNVIIYEVPMDMITNDSTAIGEIIKIRDSIGGGHLPVEDDSRFITEDAYAPYLFRTKIDNKFAYETKGIWEVKDQYMAGPFINYAIKDPTRSRIVIIEGFVYAPSVTKRDLQFELEAILKSAEIL